MEPGGVSRAQPSENSAFRDKGIQLVWFPGRPQSILSGSQLFDCICT